MAAQSERQLSNADVFTLLALEGEALKETDPKPDAQGKADALDDGHAAAEEEVTQKKTASKKVGQALVIQQKPLRITRNQLVKRVQAAPEFDVSFRVRLDQVPPETSNIVHFAVGGAKDSHAPSVFVLGGTTQLFLVMASGSIRKEIMGPEAGLELNKFYNVVVQLRTGEAKFQVEDMAVVEAILLKVPIPSSLHAFIGSPFSQAAKGHVEHLVFMSRVKTAVQSSPRVEPKEKKEMELPPAEKRLLETTERDIKKNKEWARFDFIFGVFLVANSILTGVQIEMDQEGDIIWKILDIIFLLIFIVELIARIKLSRFKRVWDLVTDPWLMFDVAVILVSVSELLVVDAPGYFGVLRLLRLMKLAKMVRLVRAFRELGILVEGILYSFQTLFWTFVLLTLTNYIGAILLVRTATLDTEGSDTNDSGNLSDFTDMGKAMWKLMQMMTFDNWAVYVRTTAFEVGGFKGGLLAIELLLFISFAGLGIMNMVAGILCHTAFVLNEKHKHMKGVETLLKQQKAMLSLKNSLRTWGERPLFQNDRFIGTDELFDAISRKEKTVGQLDEEEKGEASSEFHTPAEAAKVLNLTGEEVLTLCDTFGESGHIEIDGLIEAIRTKCLQSYFGLTSGTWIGMRITSRLRPVDMVFFNFSMMEVESYLSMVERSSTGVCSMAYDTLHCLFEQAGKADTLLRMEKNSGWRPPLQKPVMAPTLVNIKDLESSVTQSNLALEESKIYMPLDVVFGSFIVLNGIFIGFQVSDQTQQFRVPFFIIDALFTVMFTVEFVFRAILYAHLASIAKIGGGSQLSFREISAQKLVKLQELKGRMSTWRRLWLIPPMPAGGCGKVCSLLPKMLWDFSTFFDFAIIALSVADTLIISPLREFDLTSADPSILSILRIFRLFRLAKLLRIFRVFPYLQMVLFALIGVWKTVLWSLLLILLVIYAYAIYALVVFDTLPELKTKYFKTMADAMLTGWALTTFDSWVEVVEEVSAQAPGHTITLFLIIAVLGLGFMKMIIGVMSESAISLMRKTDAESHREDLIVFIQQMASLRQLFRAEFSTDRIPQEFIENALGLKLRPKLSSGEQATHGLSDKDMEVGLSRQFGNKLTRILCKAKLSSDLVKQIFEKVDYLRQGYVNIDTFANGGIVMKEDLTKIELFACMTAIREVREMSSQLSTTLATVHGQMEQVLEEMSALILRKKFASQRGKPATPNFANFSTAAKAALEELAAAQGVVPAVKSIGKLKVTNGKGLLKFHGDEAEGINTDLRTCVRPGDILIVSDSHAYGAKRLFHQRVPKTLAMSVVSIVGQERIKVSRRFVAEESEQQYTFLIVKHGQDKSEGPAESTDKDPTITHKVNVESDLSPRSAQLFFEWEMATKRRHDSKLQSLMRDRASLSKELQMLKKEAQALQDRALAQRTFSAFRQIVKVRGLQQLVY